MDLNGCDQLIKTNLSPYCSVVCSWADNSCFLACCPIKKYGLSGEYNFASCHVQHDNSTCTV